MSDQDHSSNGTGKQGSLLVIKSDRLLTEEQIDLVDQLAKDIESRVGFPCLVLHGGLDVQVHHDLGPLVAVLKEQSASISALADSNHALIAALAEIDEEEEEPARYLDGTPCR